MRKYLYLQSLSIFMILAGCDSSSSSHNNPAPVQTPIVPTASGPSVTGPVATGPGTSGDGVGAGAGADAAAGPSAGDGSTTPIASEKAIPELTSGLKITRSQFLTNLGSGVSVRIQEFRKASQALNQSALAYCAAYDPAQLVELKARFAETMNVWQGLDLFQMGPLSEDANTLKFKIYGWPQLSNYCKIDEEAMGALSDPDYDFPSNSNRKGLQALEYMIFDSSLKTICPSTVPVKAAWEALTSEQKWAARCAYMKPVAAELVANATELETKWGAPADNVVSRKIGDAAGEQGMMQALFNSLFYLDLEVKNQKLAAPAGQDIKFCNKTPSPCIDKEELRFSHLSKEALAANFRAVADIIFGFGEPRSGGLSALMRSDNALEVSDRSEKNVANLIALSESQKASFATVIAAKQTENCDATQNSWICQVRQAIKSVVADFKTEYSSVLKTVVPAAAPGDND